MTAYLMKKQRKNRKRSLRRNKPGRRMFLESLEDRRLLTGITESPHASGPSHALTDTISASVFIYENGQLTNLPADFGIESGEAISFVSSTSGGQSISIGPADVDGDDTVDNPADYLTVGDVFSTWRTNAGDAGNNTDANFSGTQLMTHSADVSNSVRMFVNGTAVHSFEDYEIHNDDRIVLAYGDDPIVAMEFPQGIVLFEMFTDDAPGTVTNFLNYVNDGDYANSIIHRSVSGFIIQGGGFTSPNSTFSSVGEFAFVPTDDTIENEFSLSNVRGTVAMAKLGGDPDSATSQWFVNTADNSANLDNQNGGFTVFAQVLDMLPVDNIEALSQVNAGGAFTDMPLASGNQLVIVESVLGQGSVSGRVYDDANENNAHDNGESGLAGVVVFSDVNGDGVLDSNEFSATTDSDGNYQLKLPSGDHEIRQASNAPYRQASPVAPLHHAISVSAGGDHTLADFANVLVTAPAGIDLVSASDTGGDDSDNLTKLTNISAATALTFDISGVTDGADVKLYDGATLLGAATASGSTVSITTNGTVRLIDGDHDLTATQSIDGVESNESTALTISVDSTVDVFTSVPDSAAEITIDYSYNTENAEEGTTGFAYSLVDAPATMTVNTDTGVVAWHPVANDLGEHTFSIRATDHAGNIRDQVVNLTVSGDAVVRYRLELTDMDGNLISTATVGDSIILRGLVEDLRDTPRGLFSAYTDVAWVDNRLTADGPITYGAEFPNVHSGSLTTDNLIDEIGGTAGFNEVGGGEYLVFSVPMTVQKAGATVVSANQADNSPHTDTLLFGENDAVDPETVIYGSVSLDVSLAFGASDDIFNFDEDTTDNSLSVMSNDTLPTDAIGISISEVSATNNGGSVSIASDGLSLLYSPAADFFGQETFTYTLSDSTGTSTANVTVQVFPVNDNPNAVNDEFENVMEDSNNVLLDVLANDSILPDANEDFSVVSVTQGDQDGSVSIGNAGLNVIYTPKVDYTGQETFTYTIRDDNGGEDTATVTITVLSENDAPVAGNDALNVPEDSVDYVIDVLANDTSHPDPDEELTVIGIGGTSKGGVATVAQDGKSILYSPAPDYFGIETFQYTVSDGNGASATAIVTVTVDDVADAPDAVDDSFSTSIDSPGDELDVLDNDTSDPDGQEPLTITAVTATTEGGTVSITGSGATVTYIPPSGFTGDDSFTYTITDDDGLTDEALVQVAVANYFPGGLSGYVYIDSDDDGVHDSDELILANVEMTLTGTDFQGDGVQLTTVTDARGKYEFTNLKPGDYVVTQEQPQHLVDGRETTTATGTTSENSISVSVGQGESVAANNFTERGRSAESLSLLDFISQTPDPSLYGSFGTSRDEQWVALDSTWQQYEETEVIWHLESHTLIINVTDESDQQETAVLSWEAGDPVRQMHTDMENLIQVSGLPESFGFEPVDDSTGDDTDDSNDDDTGDSGDDTDTGDDAGDSSNDDDTDTGDDTGDSGNDDDTGSDGDVDDHQVVKVPDFSIEDVNATSATFQQDVSPRDYDGNVTAVYFGLAPCTYCTTQFGHLDLMQQDLDSNHAELGIEIIGINLADRESGNDAMTDGRDLPWLQDVDADDNGESDVWESWDAQLRDVIILDASNQAVETYNLTLNDLGVDANYNILRDLLTETASAEGELDELIELLAQDQQENGS